MFSFKVALFAKSDSGLAAEAATLAVKTNERKTKDHLAQRRRFPTVLLWLFSEINQDPLRPEKGIRN